MGVKTNGQPSMKIQYGRRRLMQGKHHTHLMCPRGGVLVTKTCNWLNVDIINSSGMMVVAVVEKLKNDKEGDS